MALVGVALETLVFEPDAQTTRPPPLLKKKTENNENEKRQNKTQLEKRLLFICYLFLVSVPI